MSATLRYDIGVGAAEALRLYEGSMLTAEGTYASTGIRQGGIPVRSLLEECGAKHVARWAGFHRGGKTANVVTFAVKLPKQIKLAYTIMHRAYWLSRDLRKLPPGVMPQVIPAVARRGLATIANKLSLSLGIYDPGEMGVPDIFDPCNEDAFTAAIDENPSDLASWMAYADWLSESKDPKKETRGNVIAGWLAKKALKMKYGVPVIATPEKWKWLQELSTGDKT